MPDNFLPRGSRTKTVSDENLIRREHYNPNNFSVRFERMVERDLYVANSRIPLGPLFYILVPGAFVVLPHAFFRVTAQNGAELLQLVTNYGDQIGIGNKKPSRPEVRGRS